MKLSKPLSILLFTGLILLTRAVFFWKFYLHADEALFALGAKLWLNGGTPYVDFFENKPLGVYAFYALGSLASGSATEISIRSIHMASLLWTLLTTLAIQAIAARIYSERAGWIAGVLFVLFSSFWGPDIVAVHIETVLLLPWCLCILMLVRPPAELKAWHSLACGGFASAAFLCKYQAGILLPVVAVYYWILLWRSDPTWNWRFAFRHSLYFALGFLPLPFAMLFYLYSAGGLEGFYFWNFQGNISYIQHGNLAQKLWKQTLVQVSRFLASSLLLWVLAALRIFQIRKNAAAPAPPQRGLESLLWLWLLLTFIPVSVGRRFEDHYFLFLYPALSVLAAAAIANLSPLAWKKWRLVVGLGVLLPALGFTGTRYAMDWTYDRLGGEKMEAYEPYGKFLREKTSANERILVWGCAPAVYLFADRWPATRFHRTDTLAGRVAGLLESGNPGLNYQDFILPGSWDLFFEDMKKHPPAYVMDTAPTGMHDFAKWPITQYPALKEFLDKNYKEEGGFENASVYRRISPR